MEQYFLICSNENVVWWLMSSILVARWYDGSVSNTSPVSIIEEYRSQNQQSKNEGCLISVKRPTCFLSHSMLITRANTFNWRKKNARAITFASTVKWPNKKQNRNRETNTVHAIEKISNTIILNIGLVSEQLNAVRSICCVYRSIYSVTAHR